MGRGSRVRASSNSWLDQLICRHVRTTKAPHQPIPLFSEVLDILMMPENRHVKLNVSPYPDHTRSFSLHCCVADDGPYARVDRLQG